MCFNQIILSNIIKNLIILSPMFEDYFVTTNVAVALRKAGFDEPCMGAHNTQDNKLHISYTNEPTDFHTIAIKRRNSELPEHLYAAPLYDQVFDWLLQSNIRIHDVLISTDSGNGTTMGWRVYLYNGTTGKALWPPVMVAYKYPASYEIVEHSRLYKDKKQAWEQAILEAIKLLPNE